MILAVGFALALVIYRKQKQATKSVTKDVDGVDRRSSDQKLLIDMAAFDAPLASSRKDPPTFGAQGRPAIEAQAPDRR